MTVIEVKDWKYTRPPHIPEGLSEFTHPCGCREYEEDGIWTLKQCPRHKAETDAVIEKLKERLDNKVCAFVCVQGRTLS